MSRMAGWKQATVAGSFALGVVMFLSGRRPAAMVLAGIGLAVFASEHPEKFEDFWREAPEYIERGTRVVDALSRLADHLAQPRPGRPAGGPSYLA